MRAARKGIGATSVAALASALLLPACNSREVTYPTTGNSLTGTVKYGTDQLQFAMILVTQGTAGSTGMIGDDGTYFVDNVPLGEVSIAVIPDAARGVFTSKSMAAGATAKAGGGKANLRFISVPEKYTKTETSGISTTVDKGTNRYDIVMPK